MDEDLTFTASVWGTADVLDFGPPQTKSSVLSPNDEFDEFEDANAVTQPDTGDDDFGDFSEFGPAENVVSADFGEAQACEPSEWLSLKLEPLQTRLEITEQVNEILRPVWGEQDCSDVFMAEGIRDIEGINQILVTRESRELYEMLVMSPPPTRLPNWTRSRIRRQHLITLGIPINLDEVLPRIDGKPLPPLQINTRPMSAPPVAQNTFLPYHSPTSSIPSRASHPNRRGASTSQIVSLPELDHDKIKTLLDLDAEILSLQPLSVIERHLADLKQQIISASALLTCLLQKRETLQQDHETYNNLIASIVGEAQKMKSGKQRTSTLRRGSQM